MTELTEDQQTKINHLLDAMQLEPPERAVFAALFALMPDLISQLFEKHPDRAAEMVFHHIGLLFMTRAMQVSGVSVAQQGVA